MGIYNAYLEIAYGFVIPITNEIRSFLDDNDYESPNVIVVNEEELFDEEDGNVFVIIKSTLFDKSLKEDIDEYTFDLCPVTKLDYKKLINIYGDNIVWNDEIESFCIKNNINYQNPGLLFFGVPE